MKTTQTFGTSMSGRFLSQLGRLSTTKSKKIPSLTSRLLRSSKKQRILSQPSVRPPVRPSSGGERKEASGGPELVLNHYQLHDKTHTHTHNAALLEPVRRKQETCSTGEGEGWWGGVGPCHGGPPETAGHMAGTGGGASGVSVGVSTPGG